VLDEPSSGLDPMMTAHITDVVSGLASDDRAVLLATHDLHSVQAVADDVIVLDRGRIVETGTPGELLDRTDTDDLAAAMGALVSGERGEVATRESAPASAAGGDE
jgi:ABC-type multidrug transport system ATPase subunit